MYFIPYFNSFFYGNIKIKMKATKEDLHESGRPLSQEEFINKIKTDDEFAKKWGSLGKIYGPQLS